MSSGGAEVVEMSVVSDSSTDHQSHGERKEVGVTELNSACAGANEELVKLLLSRGADIEHRDKKGFTPLILAATAGHDKVRIHIWCQCVGVDSIWSIPTKFRYLTMSLCVGGGNFDQPWS